MVDLFEYLEVPFKWRGRARATGWDCWGLVLAFYHEVFGIDVPDLAGAYRLPADTLELPQGVIDNGWEEIASGNERAGDAILLRVPGGKHAAVVMPQRNMLHSEDHVGTVIESYDHGLWRHRLEGFYRHHRSFPVCIVNGTVKSISA